MKKELKMNFTDSLDSCIQKNLFTRNPYDPIKLAATTEKIVCKGENRKYFGFWITPQNYKVGVATGYTVGCCLKCVFCWASETRDDIEKSLGFYSPEEVFERLTDFVRQKRRLNRIRISDGEPTIGKQHLIKLIELTERSDITEFILETNGILLGYDSDYVKSLSQFKKLYVRLSLKAGTPEDFTRKTGAIPEAFELQFQALRNLIGYEINFGVAAMSADPRFMSPIERISLIAKLAEIDPALVLKLEEEMAVLFPTTKKRLLASGWNLDGPHLPVLLRKIPFLKRFVQFSYEPLRYVGRQKISLRYSVKAIRELFHGI
jgi:uncharacterized Fe-S cluster-containing radical SAM superfamily protein